MIRSSVGRVVVAAIFASAAPIATWATEAMPPPTISVTGEANVSAAPDTAEITGGVTTQAKTARDASDNNNKAMAAVIAALKTAGIADADIRTSRLSLQPQFASASRPPDTPTIIGYRAGNQVTVRLHDVAKVADTVDALLAAGANDIGSVSFLVSNASKLLDDARPKAIADARRKAEIYAKAAGVNVGAPVSISEGTATVPFEQRAFRATAPLAAPTPIAAGNETLSVTVSVSYEIKPATP